MIGTKIERIAPSSPGIGFVPIERIGPSHSWILHNGKRWMNVERKIRHSTLAARLMLLRRGETYSVIEKVGYSVIYKLNSVLRTILMHT